MKLRVFTFTHLCLLGSMALLLLDALGSDAPIYVEEHFKDGKFYLSYPAGVKVIKTDERYHSTAPETLLRVSVVTIQSDKNGGRRRNIFFSQKEVGRYVEAIDRFLRLSEDLTQRSSLELDIIPSWESFNIKRDLVFEYVAPSHRDETGDKAVALLKVSLAYDTHHRGGSFYFTPENAKELLNVLFDFIGEI